MTVSSTVDDRIQKCQKILENDPNSQIFAALADAFRKKGELDKAFRICQNGLKIHPNYGAAHVVMAKINMDRGLYDWAEAEVNKAAELDGTSRAIDLLLAEIYIYKGEFTDAVKLLKKLNQTDPDNKQIAKLLDIARKIPEEQRALMSAQTPPQTAPQSKEEVSSETLVIEEPAPAVKPSASDIVRFAITLNEMNGALYINDEGLVVEKEWTLDLDMSTSGAVMSEISDFLEKEMVENKFGHTEQVLIETAEEIFYLVKVTGGIFLFVASTRISLGNMRLKLSGLLDNFEPN